MAKSYLLNGPEYLAEKCLSDGNSEGVSGSEEEGSSEELPDGQRRLSRAPAVGAGLLLEGRTVDPVTGVDAHPPVVTLHPRLSEQRVAFEFR